MPSSYGGRSSWLCVPRKAEPVDSVLPAVNFGRSLNAKARVQRYEDISRENEVIADRLDRVESVIRTRHEKRRPRTTSSTVSWANESPTQWRLFAESPRDRRLFQRGPVLFREVINKCCATVREIDEATLELDLEMRGDLFRMRFDLTEAAAIVGGIAPDLLAPPSAKPPKLPFGLAPVGIDLRREAWRQLALKAKPGPAHKVLLEDHPPPPKQRVSLSPSTSVQQQQQQQKVTPKNNPPGTPPPGSPHHRKRCVSPDNPPVVPQTTTTEQPRRPSTTTPTTKQKLKLTTKKLANAARTVALANRLRGGSPRSKPKRKQKGSLITTVDNLAALASATVEDAVRIALAFRALEARNAMTDPEAISRKTARQYRLTVENLKMTMIGPHKPDPSGAYVYQQPEPFEPFRRRSRTSSVASSVPGR